MLIRNNRTVTLKLTRREVCDILLLLDTTPLESERWHMIGEKVREQLTASDKKLEVEHT